MWDEIAAFGCLNALLNGGDLPFLDRKELLDCLSGQVGLAAAKRAGQRIQDAA